MSYQIIAIEGTRTPREGWKKVRAVYEFERMQEDPISAMMHPPPGTPYLFKGSKAEASACFLALSEAGVEAALYGPEWKGGVGQQALIKQAREKYAAASGISGEGAILRMFVGSVPVVDDLVEHGFQVAHTIGGGYVLLRSVDEGENLVAKLSEPENARRLERAELGMQGLASHSFTMSESTRIEGWRQDLESAISRATGRRVRFDGEGDDDLPAALEALLNPKARA